MPIDRQLDERISRWLEAEAPIQVPDRVLRATFERTRTSRQQGGWRALLGRIQMNRSVIGVAGAALLVVVAAAALDLGRAPSGVGGTASPSPSPTAPAAPSASAAPATPSSTPAGLRPEGPHVLWSQGVRMNVTIPAPDWYGEANDGILIKNDDSSAPDGAGLIVFAGDPGGLEVYGDPCRWSTTRPTAPSTTVDELVAALAVQATRDATEPVDVSIDGHAGKAMTLHVPDDAVFSSCDLGYFGSWGIVDDATPSRYHQDPGQIDELWILDVDGELVVLDAAYYAGTPQAVVDELRAIVESMTFGG